MMESRPIRKQRRRSEESGKPRRWPLMLLALLATGLLVAGGVAMYRDQPETSQHAELIGIGETFVREQIPEEFQASFGPEDETVVEAEGEKYRIQGWVDLIRFDGFAERQHFSCLIHQETAGDWVGEDVNLIQQM